MIFFSQKCARVLFHKGEILHTTDFTGVGLLHKRGRGGGGTDRSAWDGTPVSRVQCAVESTKSSVIVKFLRAVVTRISLRLRSRRRRVRPASRTPHAVAVRCSSDRRLLPYPLFRGTRAAPENVRLKANIVRLQPNTLRQWAVTVPVWRRTVSGSKV